MKRDQIQKQEQNVQAEQKDKQIIRVRSNLRAGLMIAPDPCC
jgi:hypothetical protein